MAHYVMCKTDTYIDSAKGKQVFSTAEVVSSHKERGNAWAARDKLNSKSASLSAFVVIECELKLTKGECYPDELAVALDRERHEEATNILYALWKDGGFSGNEKQQKRYASRLAELGLTYEQLEAQYGPTVRAMFDAETERQQYRAEQQARELAAGQELIEAAQEHTYSFPAVRGIQAGKEFYIAQIPYEVLVKLFVFDDESVPPELRAQRSLSEKRAREISSYMQGNLTSYVLPALTATVSKEMRFEAVAVSGSTNRLGLLNIPMTATMLINDGQHRRRGIELAIAENPALGKETIAVTIYFDEGLERSQQIFSDINSRQVKPSSAINALYNKRDPFNAWIVALLNEMPHVKSRIDFENATVGANSHKLWSLIGFKKAVATLLRISQKTPPHSQELAHCGEFVKAFFERSRRVIPEWSAMVDGHIPAKALRQEYVIGHTVWLEALASFTNHAVLNSSSAVHCQLDELDWSAFEKLDRVHTLKSAPMWQGRCVSLGKMQPTRDGMKLTAAAMCSVTETELPAELAEAEERYAASVA